jgi:hypothetical protein
MQRLYCRIFLLLAALAAPAHAAAPADDIPPIARKVKGFDLSLLAPVAGVTLRQVGEASYYFGFVPTLTKDQVLAEVGIDKAHYDEAEKVFTQRMIDDKTFTINSLFGAYSAEASQGRFAAYGRDVAQSVLDDAPLREKEPMTEEQFRLIQDYYARKAGTAGTKPSDLDLVLVPFHLTYNDFQILSGWFGRRLALQAGAGSGQLPGATDEVANAAPPARERPELGGLWRLSWTLLKRGESAMEKVSATRDICLKSGMTGATAPLMPKRGTAKCALQHLDFYPTGIGFYAQCDQGDFGSAWALDLQPPHSGREADAWTGEMQFSMQNEVLQDLAPKASTPVTGQRIGDCK